MAALRPRQRQGSGDGYPRGGRRAMSSDLDNVGAMLRGSDAAARDDASIPARKVPWRWQHYVALVAGVFLGWVRKGQ